MVALAYEYNSKQFISSLFVKTVHNTLQINLLSLICTKSVNPTKNNKLTCYVFSYWFLSFVKKIYQCNITNYVPVTKHFLYFISILFKSLVICRNLSLVKETKITLLAGYNVYSNLSVWTNSSTANYPL